MIGFPVRKAGMILDASIVAKFLLPEENSSAVIRMISEGTVQAAPNILEFEIYSLLCKHYRNGTLSEQTVRDAESIWIQYRIEGFITLYPEACYLTKAFELSCKLRHPLYDCCYLALAQRENCPLITADRQLYERGKSIYPEIILVS